MTRTVSFTFASDAAGVSRRTRGRVTVSPSTHAELTGELNALTSEQTRLEGSYESKLDMEQMLRPAYFASRPDSAQT